MASKYIIKGEQFSQCAIYIYPLLTKMLILVMFKWLQKLVSLEKRLGKMAVLLRQSAEFPGE
jgi:hypothetical protein